MKAYGPFLLKRIARLYPLCIAMIAVIVGLGAIASLFGHRHWFITDHVMAAGLAPSILINVLNLQAFSDAHNINAPSWSISVEMGAYLAFPLLALVLFNGRRWLAAGYLAIAVAVLVDQALTEPRLGLEDRSVRFDFIRCFAEFGFGMMVYRVYRSKLAIVRWIGRDAWTWTISTLSILTLVLRIDLLIALLFPFVVLTWALNTGRARDLLSSRVPYWIGTISFSIYLVHEVMRVPALLLLQAAFPQPVPPVAALVFAAVGSLAVIPFAALAYRTVEQPGRVAIRRLADRIGRRAVVVNG